MVNEFKGSLDGKNKKIAIVISRFNEPVTQKLLEGCEKGLLEYGVATEDISVYWVPGAFEIPSAVMHITDAEAYDAVICLGAVIRGQTPHFDYVARAAAQGVSQLSIDLEIPVIFGVLTTDNAEQAFERAGGAKGNKGHDSALAALEMISLYEN